MRFFEENREVIKMKSTRGLKVALVVMLILGTLFMATTPSYAWRGHWGWWGWPVGVGIGLGLTAPYWAGYPYYYGYYPYYGYPYPYYPYRPYYYPYSRGYWY